MLCLYHIEVVPGLGHLMRTSVAPSIWICSSCAAKGRETSWPLTLFRSKALLLYCLFSISSNLEGFLRCCETKVFLRRRITEKGFPIRLIYTGCPLQFRQDLYFVSEDAFSSEYSFRISRLRKILKKNQKLLTC